MSLADTLSDLAATAGVRCRNLPISIPQPGAEEQ